MPGSFLDLPPGAIRLVMCETGHHSWRDVQSPWMHEKTVAEAIIAQAYVGRYELEYGGRNGRTGPGGAFISPPLTPLRILHIPDKRRKLVAARWIHCRFTLFETVDLFSLLEMPLILDADRTGEFAQKLRQLQPPGELCQGLRDSALRVEVAWTTLRLICEVSTIRRQAWELVLASDRLLPLLQHMRRHLGEPISVAEMASMVHMSPSAFFEFFRKHLGRSPMDYLKHLRLNEAAHRLGVPDVPVRQVADGVGFANPFHFSREFSRQFGMSPTEYRQMRQRDRAE